MSRLTISRPPAAEGVSWFQRGWQLFWQAVIAWMGMAALILLALTLLGSVPYVGKLVVEVLSPFLVAGFMAASRAGRSGEPVTFLYLGAGFREAPQALTVIGVVYLAAGLLVEQVMRALGGSGFEEMALLAQNPQAIDPKEAEAALAKLLPAMLVGLALFMPALFATWFSPALVLFDRFPPGRAMWWSLWACLVNWRPIAVYTLVLTATGVVAMLIPFGLGLLLFVPIAMTSTYAAYEAMFVRREVEA